MRCSAVATRSSSSSTRILPRRPAAAREAPRVRPRPAPGVKRGKVLVVDDELLVGKSLARLLAAHDVTVLTSPAEVLQRAAAGERWDVVLCDLMMPEMSGMEWFEEARRTVPALESRVVFVTGGAFTDAAREFLERVPNARLEKPFTPDEVRAVVAARLPR